MSAALRHRLKTLAAVLILAVVAAGAQAATTKGPTVVLRGSQPVTTPAPPPPPALLPPDVDPGIGPPVPTDLSVAPRFQDNPAPRFSLDPAPRVGGLDLLGGGAQCRTACAESRYICRVDQDADLCDAAWGRCVASCTQASAGRL